MGAGRPKNTPSRPKRALIALLQEKYPGYQPVIEIAKAAHKLTDLALEAEKAEEIELRVSAATLWKDAGTQHDRVAKYVTPQLKAIEVTGPDGGAVKTQTSVVFVGVESNGSKDT